MLSKLPLNESNFFLYLGLMRLTTLELFWLFGIVRHRLLFLAASKSCAKTPVPKNNNDKLINFKFFIFLVFNLM